MSCRVNERGGCFTKKKKIHSVFLCDPQSLIWEIGTTAPTVPIPMKSCGDNATTATELWGQGCPHCPPGSRAPASYRHMRRICHARTLLTPQSRVQWAVWNATVPGIGARGPPACQGHAKCACGAPCSPRLHQPLSRRDRRLWAAVGANRWCADAIRKSPNTSCQHW